MGAAKPEDERGESFATRLKEVRQRLDQKQLWLSIELGCSGAIVSYWETGARLPNSENLSRILAALARGGASTEEILALRRAWRNDIAKRSLDPNWS